MLLQQESFEDLHDKVLTGLDQKLQDSKPTFEYKGNRRTNPNVYQNNTLRHNSAGQEQRAARARLATSGTSRSPAKITTPAVPFIARSGSGGAVSLHDLTQREWKMDPGSICIDTWKDQKGTTVKNSQKGLSRNTSSPLTAHPRSATAKTDAKGQRAKNLSGIGTRANSASLGGRGTSSPSTSGHVEPRPGTSQGFHSPSPVTAHRSSILQSPKSFGSDGNWGGAVGPDALLLPGPAPSFSSARRPASPGPVALRLQGLTPSFFRRSWRRLHSSQGPGTTRCLRRWTHLLPSRSRRLMHIGRKSSGVLSLTPSFSRARRPPSPGPGRPASQGPGSLCFCREPGALLLQGRQHFFSRAGALSPDPALISPG
ncbi:hypothetical protein CYMTET_36676 [Cymbomonas tetramitiformis]|uniref:Uncharacterized protein n=1 Tax=Cymbomonas tetramitiformis TaxID=36881 RepID=A0AAE0CFH5_9CHLO|nr:hypothetical protein CYMTET_36676 [Cymbomonas tetramitiformis]